MEHRVAQASLFNEKDAASLQRPGLFRPEFVEVCGPSEAANSTVLDPQSLVNQQPRMYQLPQKPCG